MWGWHLTPAFGHPSPRRGEGSGCGRRLAIGTGLCECDGRGRPSYALRVARAMCVSRAWSAFLDGGMEEAQADKVPQHLPRLLRAHAEA